MNDCIDDTRQQLFERIVTALRSAGRLNATILEYVDATLFDPVPHRLAAFLDDDANCERDSLLDLIFYPEYPFQIDIEPLLAAAEGQATQRLLADRLAAERIDLQIRLPDNRPLTRIVLPDFIKAQYLLRLKVDWQMDSDVAAAIAAGVCAVMQPHVGVRLRNSGLVFSANRRRLLIRFLERMADDAPDYLACLEVVLPLVARSPADADAYDLLADHKRRLFRSLQQMQRVEDLRRRSTMETLMLQGVRMPPISRETTQRQMGLIDQICYRLFGKTETIAVPMEEPVQHVADLETPAAAIRSLIR